MSESTPMTIAAQPAEAAPVVHRNRLAEFPVSFFAIILGLSGLTLATRAAEHALALGPVASPWLAWTTAGVLGLVGLFYFAKLLLHPDRVMWEWNHPVRIAFFPAISISLLLLSAALMPLAPGVAEPMWMVGAAAQAVLALSVVASWIGHRPYQQAHMSPAWFIPAVGNIAVPLAGVGMGYPEISWLFFSAGLVFWVVLLTLVFNRLVFHDPLPGRLLPTLVILIAPPAVGYVAWLRLMGEEAGTDPFGRILLNIGYVFLGVVLTQVHKLARLPFVLSWWALSFPVAALSIASMLYAERAGSHPHELIGLGLWGLLAVLVAALALRTIVGIFRHEICVPE